MGLWVHQHVLVVLREELLHESVAAFVDGLNDETTLLRLDKETASLVLGDTHCDVGQVVRGEGLRNKELTDILNFPDHREDFWSKFNEFIRYPLRLILSLVHFLNLALFVELILLESDVESSEDVWVSKNESL